MLPSEDNLLSIRNLRIGVKTVDSGWKILSCINEFSVRRGEFLALVGETGSGKSLTAASCIRLFPSRAARILEGEAILDGRDIFTLGKKELGALRGREVAMIFQDPMSALNPVFRTGSLVSEVIRSHFHVSRAEAMQRAAAALISAGLDDPKAILCRYPHQLSGGQRQRVCIAMALACEPKLLIADEPTTALDVTIQAQILRLLDSLRRDRGLTILFITHNFGIVSQFADRIAVMNGGQIVEIGSAHTVLESSSHEYTRLLVKAAKMGSKQYVLNGLANKADGREERTAPAVIDTSAEDSALGNDWAANPPAMKSPVVEMKGVYKNYHIRESMFAPPHIVSALSDINLSVFEYDSLGLVGESGSGKSTIAKILMRLEAHSQGKVKVMGRDIAQLNDTELVEHYGAIQMVFQDSTWAMDPFMSLEKIIDEPLRRDRSLSRAQRLDIAHDMLLRVGLSESHFKKYPAELSGGQRQRAGIARALVQKPRLLILDEPTSSLDVLVQAQILDLLRSLRETFHLTYILISHDFTIIRSLCETAAVLKKGILVEYGPIADVFTRPASDYTRELIAAIPD